MTRKTHVQGGLALAGVAAVVLHNEGIVLSDYYSQTALLLLLSAAFSTAPDLDHDWSNVGLKNPYKGLANFLLTKVFKAKHRSKWTHTLDLSIVFFIGLCYTFIAYKNTPGLILAVGAGTGWLSHLIMDMLTGAGVYIAVLKFKKVAFVPKKLFGFRFNTNDAWEALVYNLFNLVNYALAIILWIIPSMPQIITSLVAMFPGLIGGLV